jgi:signal transduction histidine kinase
MRSGDPAGCLGLPGAINKQEHDMKPTDSTNPFNPSAPTGRLGRPFLVVLVSLSCLSIVAGVSAGVADDPWVLLRGAWMGALLFTLILAVRPLFHRKGSAAGASVDTRATESSPQVNDAIDPAERIRCEFLATITDELRTPMNGLLGFAELLSETSLTHDQREYVAMIQTSCRLHMRLINDMIDLLRLQNRSTTLEVVSFDPATLAREVGSEFEMQITEKRLAFRLELREPLPSPLRGDPARLRQVLRHFLDNAIKFTREGSVTLTVEAAAEGEDQLLQFTVSDTGPGIPPEHRSRLFRVLSPGDTSAARAHRGAGLGLAICKGLVELMSGTIGVLSAPGQGSSFWVKIPFPVEKRSAGAIELPHDRIAA